MATSHTELWQRATVVEVRPVADAVQRIVLAPEHPVAIEPGAHLDVRLPLGTDTVQRSYSIVDADSSGSRISLSVFRSVHSRGGAGLMHALVPGDMLTVSQPLQDFPLRFGASSYVLLAGGIGITAIAGMARVLRDRGDDYRLIYVGRTRAAMAYLDELIALHGDRLDVHVGDENTSLDVRRLVATLEPDTELYQCGPIRLMDAVRREWIERELPIASLRFETFGNSGWFEPQEFTVRLPQFGIETVVGPTQSMLEALEAAGADMMFDCRKGECGLCEVRVLELEGEIDHRDVFYSERQRDARSKLCCCVSRVARPQRGAVVTISSS